VVRGWATTPVLVTTDYPLASSEAAELLRSEESVVLLSSGAAQLERTPASDEEFAVVLRLVCGSLALGALTEAAA
jgi:hypothetical protein